MMDHNGRLFALEAQYLSNRAGDFPPLRVVLHMEATFLFDADIFF